MARIRKQPASQALPLPEKRWRVGTYIRLSKEDGNEESESVANQRKILAEQLPQFFCGDYLQIDEYIDDGRTGTSDDTRPGFLRLVQDVKNGRINCIVTKNLSRAFRNSANQGKFLEEFIPLYNTRFISLYEPHFDTFLNPEVVHSLEVSMTGFINEQYAYKTSLDVRRTLDAKRRRGEFIGAFAPYGYKKRADDHSRLEIDESAAWVVRAIFHWFTQEGLGKAGIAKRLNELGIPNPTAYKRRCGMNYQNPQAKENDGMWSEKTVREILLNEVYTGSMVQGRQKVISYKLHRRVNTDQKDWYVVPGCHEPIVEEAVYRQALSLHQKDTRVLLREGKVSLFSGMLRCSGCGKSMVRKTSKGCVYYCCSTYTRKSKLQCTSHTIREDMLKELVLSAIRSQVEALPSRRELFREIRCPSKVPLNTEPFKQLLSQKKELLRKTEHILDEFYFDRKSGEMGEEDYQRRKKKWVQRRKELEEEAAHMEKKLTELTEKQASQPAFLTEFEKQGNVPFLTRGLLTALVDTILVGEGEIRIQFRFQNPAP